MTVWTGTGAVAGFQPEGGEGQGMYLKVNEKIKFRYTLKYKIGTKKYKILHILPYSKSQGGWGGGESKRPPSDRLLSLDAERWTDWQKAKNSKGTSYNT